ncbi:MAG: metal-dependent hydrolase [Saccharofermentans sp.]|nr:metal-dependent hydrolase [Saccharofermentans sp.]
MMSKTHIVNGISLSLLLLLPHGIKSMIPVIIGAAIGSVISDLDSYSDSDWNPDNLRLIESSDDPERIKRRLDARTGGIIVSAVIAVSLLVDYFVDDGLINNVIRGNHIMQIMGLVGFLTVCLCCRFSERNSFSHSFLALGLEAISLLLIFPKIIFAFIIAYVSHLFLDLLNYKEIRLFFPAEKGFCFDGFEEDGLTNKVLLIAGCAFLVYSIICCIIEKRLFFV